MSNLNKRSGFRLFLLVLTLCAALGMCAPALALDIPKPGRAFYVNDTAGVIRQENEDYIVAAADELQVKTDAQVVVVTIPSLNGAPIEEFATELFRSYGIGDAKKNNGILFLLALEDRECRIEVGYGLEGVINDAKAGRIMDRYMIPYFKEGKWDEGIVNGFDAILDELCGEYGVEIAHREAEIPAGAEAGEESGDNGMLWSVVFASVFGLLAGLLIGAEFPDQALIPGTVFLLADLAVLIAVFTAGYAILAFALTVVVYLIGWAITSPSPGGSSGSYHSVSGRSSYSASGRSHSASSGRHSGGGGRSGGAGASRKF